MDSNDENERELQRSRLQNDMEVASERLDELVRGETLASKMWIGCGMGNDSGHLRIYGLLRCRVISTRFYGVGTWLSVLEVSLF